jgi:phosphatidate cytidylyltransferase
MTGDEPADAGRGMIGGRNLPAAIAVGLLLAGVFLGSVFWRTEAFGAVIALLAALACVEVGRVLRPQGTRLIVPVMVLTVVVAITGAYVAGAAGQRLGVGVLLLGSVLWVLFDRRRTDIVNTLATTVLFGLWIAFLASYGVLLHDRPDGAVVVLAVVGAAVVADIGGYAFGVPFGRHKVAPSVSPNKSWEGLLGGLLVAAGLAALVLPLVGDTFAPGSAAALAVLCGLAAFFGDLTESMIKRDLGVKDLGELLPGHGGVLDRVDGILFALPVGYHTMVWFV